MMVKEVVVVISASTVHRSHSANVLRKYMLSSDLMKLSVQNLIRYDLALGYWYGDCEASFVCVIQKPEAFSMLMGLAEYYAQECVLVRDNDGVYLHYTDGRKPERIGRDLYKVQCDSRNIPDCCTYFKGDYWVAR